MTLKMSRPPYETRPPVSHFRGRYSCVVPILLCVVCGGCGGAKLPPPPTVYPAHGTVKYQDGQPVPSGMVQFSPVDNSPVTITGAIQPDGTFELKTMHVNANLSGAIAGKFKVTIIPPIGAAPTQVPAPFYLPDPVEIRPGDNNFSLEIER